MVQIYEQVWQDFTTSAFSMNQLNTVSGEYFFLLADEFSFFVIPSVGYTLKNDAVII